MNFKKALLVTPFCLSLLACNSNRYEFPNSELLIELVNKNCHYVLNEWWFESKEISFADSYLPNHHDLTPEEKREVDLGQESFRNWKDSEYLFIPNWKNNVYSENAILPACYASRVVSTALYYDFYDDSIVGVDYKTAKEMIVKLISSLAKYHASNSTDGWGHCWQGALWAEMLGQSAYFLKDDLASTDYEYVTNMVRSEADYVINSVGTTFYKDKQGNVNEGYTGDSQSETVAWNATIIALCHKLFPNIEIYKEKLIEFCVSALVRPLDLNSKLVIDGYSLDSLAGSNVNDDGTVTNHDKFHIDYMVSPIESLAECYIVLPENERQTFNSLLFNVDTIYGALVELDFEKYNVELKNHHFYERDANGLPTHYTSIPDAENEWGNYRQANYYLTDVYVGARKMDNTIKDCYKSDKWAACRIKEIKRMMDRSQTGIIYQGGEEYFASGQLYAMACLAQAFSIYTF